ncbi:ABC transporter, ATP-binding protein [Collinsella intestinalis DSM 13280]|uniref:ABC transporter, ATP-binding protein n=1 Tax=Collinsella intestinalis DSM 13280 TaxID=521003 RepID=C4F9C8_9ACTN|nr:energy-coupling factor transporter ATPase [Collinsella intestinalis]EEP44616.1 ABC transporter, ATP-binding protein [Collinsella intestinalis DSM 13280]
MSAIIEMECVSFSYGTAADGAYALKDIDLSVEEGTFVGLIGPSGAGKSTLASAITGAIPHHYRGRLFGSTLVAGLDTCEASLTDIAKVAGSVLQDIDAQMVASVVEDELLFGLENFGIDHREIEGRIASALDAVGIADLRHREIATLSGGQKQKVAIAAILAMTPRVIVMDEPTSALDPASARDVFEVLRRAKELTGMTVILIEQTVALLAEYCDRVVVIDQGRIALDGTPTDVFSHGETLRAIGVDTPRTVRISNSLAEAGLAPNDSPALTLDGAESLVAGILAPGLSKSSPIVPCALGDGPNARNTTDERPIIVDVAGAAYSYGTGQAGIEGIDLTVRAGEILAVVGQNGAGKTTFTKLLNGLIKPSAGVVRIAGLDTRTTPVSALASHAATLFQNPDRQLCRNTVVEEISFGLELQGAPADAARERARRVAATFGLPENASPFNLSRGQRQMVALASVVALEPELIILDEPTSGLDYRECMTVMETVRQRALDGAAVVMVCHDMEVVSDFADTLAVMTEGRLIEVGPSREVFANDALLAHARIAAPCVPALGKRLAARFHSSFAHITEVADLVALVKELKAHA